MTNDNLPEVTRKEARRLVLSVATFWACFALALPTVDDGIGFVLFLIAFPTCWFIYYTLFKIWDTPMFVLPGRGYLQHAFASARVTFSVINPAFIRRVLRATGWPPVLVGCVLVSLLAADFIVMAVSTPADPACEAKTCQ
jgi:hypothetical protein